MIKRPSRCDRDCQCQAFVAQEIGEGRDKTALEVLRWAATCRLRRVRIWAGMILHEYEKDRDLVAAYVRGVRAAERVERPLKERKQA